MCVPGGWQEQLHLLLDSAVVELLDGHDVTVVSFGSLDVPGRVGGWCCCAISPPPRSMDTFEWSHTSQEKSPCHSPPIRRLCEELGQ